MLYSMVLMVTGDSSRLSVQDASQGAGQMRPVNSGKLLVECSDIDCRLPVPAVDQIVPVRNQIIDRAAGVAKWDAAVHATCTLDTQIRLAQGLTNSL